MFGINICIEFRSVMFFVENVWLNLKLSNQHYCVCRVPTVLYGAHICWDLPSSVKIYLSVSGCSCVCVCMCMCAVCMVLITTMFLWARSQNWLLSVSVRREHLLSCIWRLFSHSMAIVFSTSNGEAKSCHETRDNALQRGIQQHGRNWLGSSQSHYCISIWQLHKFCFHG